MASESSDAKPAKKSRKLLFIILGVVVLALAGGGFMMMKHKKDAEEEDGAPAKKHAAKDVKPPVFVPMDDFLVNLPGRGGEHFLQAKVVLRTADSANESKIKNYLPMIRDRLLTVMSQRPMEVLATVEGKNSLTRDMALTINAVLDPQLTAMYVMTRDPTGAELRNLERIGVIPNNILALAARGGSGRSAAQLMEISEMDLPVQAVLFSSFVMQ